MKGWRFFLVVLFGAPLGACAVKPTPSLTCALKTYDLRVENPSDTVPVSGNGPPTFGDLLDRNLFSLGAGTAPVDGSGRAPDPSMLFLSGGSLHGAFGAGVLDEWRLRSPSQRLPDFRVVTGISTGSILSTFAFLNRTDEAVAGYSIDRESQLLTPLVSMKNGEPTLTGYAGLMRKGALADLAPLRETLGGYIDNAALEAVAEEARRDRLLLAGVVDVDTGQAVIIDLTDLALRYSVATEPLAKADMRTCYIDSIIASSSAPMAALPVFIDNRMYVDGGMRFGMFTDEIGNELRRAAAIQRKPRIYLIINGDQEVSRKCGKADPKNCLEGPEPDPTSNTAGEHKSWNFTQLALRSEGILANQVYRFSADRVKRQAHDTGFDLKSLQIGPDMMRHAFTLDDADLGPTATHNCREWHDIDAAIDDPVQFFPRYMRCVIDYGRVRARAAQWQQGAIQ